MILRVGGVARRAIRAGRSGKNSLEYLDEFDDAHFEPGFFGEFPGDALCERFAHFEQPAGNGPFSFEGRAAAPNEQGAGVVNHYSADTYQGLIGVFSSACHGRFWLFPSRAASRYIILQQQACPSPKEVFAVVRCPECATEIDVDEDEVEEGEILACPECETEMEVVQIHPVKVNAISEDDDEEEEEESEDGDEFADDDDEEDEEEEV